MILELKPEQQRVLDQAAKAGMNPEEVLDQAFAVIASQLESGDWMLEEREAVNALIEERVAEAERGESIDGNSAIEALRKRHSKRQIA